MACLLRGFYRKQRGSQEKHAVALQRLPQPQHAGENVFYVLFLCVVSSTDVAPKTRKMTGKPAEKKGNNVHVRKTRKEKERLRKRERLRVLAPIRLLSSPLASPKLRCCFLLLPMRSQIHPKQTPIQTFLKKLRLREMHHSLHRFALQMA